MNIREKTKLKNLINKYFGESSPCAEKSACIGANMCQYAIYTGDETICGINFFYTNLSTEIELEKYTEKRK